MIHTRALPSVALICGLVGACGAPEEGEVAAEATSAVVNGNGIRLSNGLRLTNGFRLSNGVTLPNGLRLTNGVQLDNGLRLTNGLIQPPSGSALERWLDDDSTNKKRVLRYLVECALPPSKKVTFTYRGASETWSGMTGFAPGWAQGEMNEVEQERVSACLLARINAKGEVVSINIFGPWDGFDSSSASEMNLYPAKEAGFFGNIFADPPIAHACGSPSFNAPGRMCETRVCATGSGCDCGITVTSDDCKVDNGCAPIHIKNAPGNVSFTYYADCEAGGRTWTNVVTAFRTSRENGDRCNYDYECMSGNCRGRAKCGSDTIALQAKNGDYLVANDSGSFKADQSSVGEDEIFTLIDLNGKWLESQDYVNLQVSGGDFVSAKNGGGSSVSADRSSAGTNERLRVVRVDGPGRVQDGDKVAFQTASGGSYLSAVNGGGHDVRADKSSIGSWETFTYRHK